MAKKLTRPKNQGIAVQGAAERSVAGCGGLATAPATDRPGGQSAGASPSNTAPANCKTTPLGSKILRCAVDSLYLSFTGYISPEISEILGQYWAEINIPSTHSTQIPLPVHSRFHARFRSGSSTCQ